MADTPESVLLVTDHIAGSRALSELGPDLPDAVLTGLWDQLRRAHAAGLAHRSLSGDSVVVDEARRVWLLDWDSGETISSELSRRVDLAQALALLAGSVGVERAIASASRILTTAQLASIAPMLQRVVLPADTRRAMGRRGRILQELRDALVALTPTAHAEPARINRFQARTVVMAVIFLVAVWTLLARMNFEEVSDAVAEANAWWILGALIFSLATYVGAGIILVAFTPERLSLWRSTEVHLASSVVALVAPAGVGGAAINLRFLTRKGVPTAVGVATVALVQVVQFLVTLVLLVILAATTGQSTGLTLPSGWVLLGAVLLAAIVAIVLAVPQARAWIWEKIEPTYRQVQPRLVWVLSNPIRLLAGVGGSVLLSLSYILAFGASLWAFGLSLPFSVLAITYFASNTVGSVVPSPGGIGPASSQRGSPAGPRCRPRSSTAWSPSGSRSPLAGSASSASRSSGSCRASTIPSSGSVALHVLPAAAQHDGLSAQSRVEELDAIGLQDEDPLVHELGDPAGGRWQVTGRAPGEGAQGGQAPAPTGLADSTDDLEGDQTAPVPRGGDDDQRRAPAISLHVPHVP